MKVRRLLITLVVLLLAVPAAYALNPTDSEGGGLGDAGDSPSSATKMRAHVDGSLTTVVDRDDWYWFSIVGGEHFAFRLTTDDNIFARLVPPEGNSTSITPGVLYEGTTPGRWYVALSLWGFTQAHYSTQLLVGNHSQDAAVAVPQDPEPAPPAEDPPADDAAAEAAEEPPVVEPAPESEEVATFADLTVEVVVEDEYDGLYGDALEAMRLVRLRVINHGDGASPEGVLLHLAIDARTIPGMLGESSRYLRLPALEPGHEAAYEHRWDTSRAVGEYLVTAKVDVHNMVPEPIESDNLAMVKTHVRLS